MRKGSGRGRTAESRSPSVSLGQTCLSLVLTSRALVARGTVILGCFYKDLISCWLLEPADQLRSRKGSLERWRWLQHRAVSHLRARTVGWPPPLCSGPRLPLLQNGAVQGVVMRDEGMENQTERNLRPAPRKSVLGKSSVAFVIIQGFIIGLMESQAQMCDSQVGAPFVEGPVLPTRPVGPVTALGLRECTHVAVVGGGCAHSARPRSRRGPYRAGSGCRAFFSSHLRPPPFSCTSWFTAPRYRSFPTLELFSCLRTGVARTFLFLIG